VEDAETHLIDRCIGPDLDTTRRRRIREQLGKLPEASQRIEDADVRAARIRIQRRVVELYCGQ